MAMQHNLPGKQRQRLLVPSGCTNNGENCWYRRSNWQLYDRYPVIKPKLLWSIPIILLSAAPYHWCQSLEGLPMSITSTNAVWLCPTFASATVHSLPLRICSYFLFVVMCMFFAMVSSFPIKCIVSFSHLFNLEREMKPEWHFWFPFQCSLL
jgi:hypothetical protein